MAQDIETIPDLNETLRKTGWVEVGAVEPGAGSGVWRAPGEADDPTGRKYTAFAAAVEELRRQAAKPKAAPRKKSG